MWHFYNEKRVFNLWIAIFGIVFIFLPSLEGTAKTIDIPSEIKIEENTVKETRIRNLSDDEIFQVLSLYFYDNSFYLVKLKPIEIIHLNLAGEIKGRAGKEGAGPQEVRAVNGIQPFKKNIAVLDSANAKILFYTGDLKYLKETRMKSQFYNFFIDKHNNFVFFDDPSKSYYFDVYSEKLDFIRTFGETAAPAMAIQKNILMDSAFSTYYTLKKNGLWVSFRNRYDLRYYRDEKLEEEIKAPGGFFKRQERKIPDGRVVVMPMDKPDYLAGDGKYLYYFYLKDWKSFCDIFDAGSLQLLRRVKFANSYRYYAHFKDNVFFAVCTDPDDNLLLVKLEL